MSGEQNDELEMEERDVSSTGAQPKDMNEIMNNTEGEEEEEDDREDRPLMCTEESTQENAKVEKTLSNSRCESVRNSKEDVRIERTPFMSTEGTDQTATPESSRRTPDADKKSAVAPKTGEESRERYPKQEENSLRNGSHGTQVIIPGTTSHSAPETAVQIETPAADDNQTNGPENKGRPCMPACCKNHQCMILGVLIVVLAILAIANLVRIQVQHHQQTAQKLSQPQFHHSLLHLNTEYSDKLDGATSLHWTKDEKQSIGNIQLVNDTYIYVPQGGVYQINCAVQLHVPENTSTVIITMLFQKKNGTKYKYLKMSSKSLKSRSEHAIIQSSFTYKFKANDTMFLKMNMAKFISHNEPSSYLSITSLHLNDPQ